MSMTASDPDLIHAGCPNLGSMSVPSAIQRLLALSAPLTCGSRDIVASGCIVYPRRRQLSEIAQPRVVQKGPRRHQELMRVALDQAALEQRVERAVAGGATNEL